MALLGAVVGGGGGGVTFGHLYSERLGRVFKFYAFEVGDGTRFSF